ncbi:hypothetical protein ACFX10_008545 [Malus domestica]
MTPRGGTRCLYFPCNALLCLVLTMFILWLIFLPKEPQFTVSSWRYLENVTSLSFNSETAAGVYSIDVKISLRVRARFGKIKTPDYGPSNINCNLKVPLSLSETLPSGFNATKCRNVHVLTNPSNWPRISDFRSKK